MFVRIVVKNCEEMARPRFAKIKLLEKSSVAAIPSLSVTDLGNALLNQIYLSLFGFKFKPIFDTAPAASRMIFTSKVVKALTHTVKKLPPVGFHFAINFRHVKVCIIYSL